MKLDKSYILIIILFLALSLVISWKAIIADGHFVYRDAETILNLESFKEDFFHIHKKYGATPFDFQKRIPELWIHFFVDYELYDKIKFTLLPFITLIISFFVSDKILEKENINGRERKIIAFAVAVFYLINPLNTQILLKYYPAINYAIFPLFFYTLYEGFVQTRRKYVFYSALIGTFMFCMVIHSLIYLGISILIISIISALKKQFRIKRFLVDIVNFFLVFVSLTAFITLPYIAVSTVSGIQEGVHKLNIETLDSFSASALLPRVMLMDFEPFWWPWVPYSYPFETIFFILFFVLSAILIIYAIYDKNDWSLMALMGLVILFFFSKGNSAPFSEFYEILNFNTPAIGWLLRVPNKFLYIVPFFFSILFLRFSVFTVKNSKRFFYAFLIISLGLLSIYSWPFFTGDMAGYLNKTNYDDLKEDFEAINSIVVGDDASVRTYGISWKDNRNIHGDILNAGVFINRELESYANYGNWSGLQIIPYLGVQYIVAPLEYDEKISIYAEQLLRGNNYSLFKMKTDASIVSIPEESYLCYCNFDTARSIIRDTPKNKQLEVLMFPYSSLDFPQKYIDESEYIILDSTPVVFSRLSSEDSISFRSLIPNPSRGWANIRIDQEDIMGSNSFDFGEGISIINKKLEIMPSSERSYKEILSMEDIELLVFGGFTNRSENTFRINPSSENYYSVVSAELDLKSGFEYEVFLDIDGNSLSNFIAEIIFQDSNRNILSKVLILESNGSFTRGENITIYITNQTDKTSIRFLSKTPEEIPSSYTINNLKVGSFSAIKEGDRITSGFYIPEADYYGVYVRVLKSKKSGNLGFYLDEEYIGKIDTYDNLNYFSWERIYYGNISNGKHNITVEQLDGYNGINIVYIKKDGLEEVEFIDKTIIYRLTGKNDFYGNKTKIVNGNSSTFYLLKVKEPVIAHIDVISEGKYDISHAIQGSAEVIIDGMSAAEEIYLEKGRHEIQVKPTSSNVYLDHVTLIKEGKERKQEASILEYEQINPSTYSILVNSSTPFFLSFGRGYNELWIAWANGTAYVPVPLYGAANVYYIEETGLTPIIIEYSPQKFLYAGLVIGIIGLAYSLIGIWRSKS